MSESGGNSNRSPERNPRPRRTFWLRALLVGGGVTLIGLMAVGWWAWRFIREQLAPLVARELSQALDRPVEVGPVEDIWFNRLDFGQSAIPATPTDPDRATLEAVQIRFNLLELLVDRTLSLDITLVRPELVLVQNQEGVWLDTKIQQQDEEQGPIKIELDTLTIQDGNAQLVAFGGVERSQPIQTEDQPDRPANQNPDAPETLERGQTANPVVGLTDINGSVTFRNQNQLITYDVATRPETGGNVRVRGTTNLEAEATTLRVESRDLLAADVSLLVPLPLKLQLGRIASNLEVQFLPNNQPLQFDGNLSFENIAARLDGAPQPFREVNGRLQFRGQRVAFENFQGRYGEVLAKVGGSLDTQKGYDLRVQVPQATVPQILETVEFDPADLPVELAGAFQAEFRVTGAIDAPQVAGTARNVQPVQIDRVQFADTRAAFTVSPQAVVVQSFQATPSQGGQITASGTVRLGERPGLVVDVQGTNLPGDAIARTYGASSDAVAIGRVNATAQVLGPLDNIQTIVQWQAPQATYPARGRVVIANGDIRFEDTVALVANGIVRGNGLIRQNRWQANLDTRGIALAQFSPELRGALSGNFQLAGRLDNLNLAAIEAEGQARLSEGASIIEGPLDVSLRWLGDRLQIVQATAPNFQADGFVFAQLSGAGAPAVSNLDVNVALRNYPLTDLPVTLPTAVRLAGSSDFEGRITGPLNAVAVTGQLGLNNLAVNTLAFEPRLQGNLRFQLNQGLAVDLVGTQQQDRIAVVLDSRYRPESFYLRQGEAIAEGRSQNDRLVASLTNFPLAALNYAPAAEQGLGIVTGVLNGNLVANLADLSNPAIQGEVAIANPALDFIKAESFRGRFRYVDGVAVLEEGAELRFTNSRYLLQGSFNPGTDPQFQGQVIAEAGRVEDVLAALRWFEIADLGQIPPPPYAPPEQVQTSAVGLRNATLLNQLRRYSEIKSLYRQQLLARTDAQFLPELSTLRGGFSGTVDLAYSNRSGPSVAFDLSGQDWQWGDCSAIPRQVTTDAPVTDLLEPPSVETALQAEAAAVGIPNAQVAIRTAALANCRTYQVNQVVAQGNLRDGVLTLLPVSLQTEESLLTFSGQLGGEEQSGQLIAENVPVAALRDLFRLPINIEGDLDATATLGGSPANPQFEGAINLVDGRVTRENDGQLQTEAIPPVRALFGYNNARLNFNTRFLVAEAPEGAETPTDPVPPAVDDSFQFNGSIPFQFPFAQVAPDNYQVSIDLNLADERLVLVNLFTDQVSWQGGEGTVQLQVRGELPPGRPELNTLFARGTATFVDAQIGAKALPEPLTNVNGTAFFENDRIRIVDPIVGQLGPGEVTVTGVIPLQSRFGLTDADAAQPLTVSLNKLELNLENIYDGSVMVRCWLRAQRWLR